MASDAAVATTLRQGAETATADVVNAANGIAAGFGAYLQQREGDLYSVAAVPARDRPIRLGFVPTIGPLELSLRERRERAAARSERAAA